MAGAVLRLMHYLDDFLVFGNSEAAVATKLAEFKLLLYLCLWWAVVLP